MKKYVLLMSLFLSSTSFADSMSLPERLSSIRGDSLKTEPLATYDIRQLQSRYPTPLLLPSSLLPQSAKYPLKALRQLYKQSLVCKGPWPVSPLVTQPVVFVRAMCFGTPLPRGWFVRAGYIHPGGGSYAYRYLEKHPQDNKKLDRYLHIKERPLAEANSILGRLQRMSDEEIESFYCRS